MFDIIGICDDNPCFLTDCAQKIESVLKENRMQAEIRTFSSGEEVIYAYKEGYPVDILFLDIDMPGLDGEETARELRKINSTFQLIFLTSMTDRVYDTFAYGIASFIPKTRLSDKLKTELLRVLDLIHNQKIIRLSFSVTALKSKEKQLLNLPVNDISHLESVNRTMLLHTASKTYELAEISYEAAKKQLLEQGFIETHRTCVVNPKYISLVENARVILDGGKDAPLSRRKRQDVIQAISTIAREGTR